MLEKKPIPKFILIPKVTCRLREKKFADQHKNTCTRICFHQIKLNIQVMYMYASRVLFDTGNENVVYVSLIPQPVFVYNKTRL